MICTKCGNNLVQGTKFCPYCGEKTGVYCPICGAKENGSSKFCSQCGVEILSYSNNATEGKMVWEQKEKIPSKILEYIYDTGIFILCILAVFLFNSLFKDNTVDLNKAVNEIMTTNKEQKPQSFSSDQYEGEWWDMNSQRCYMEICLMKDEQLEITIYWGNGAYENTIWHMYTYYNSNTGYLEYQNGEQLHFIYSETGEEQKETVYRDGTGYFYLLDGYLYWVDNNENMGDGCCFERYDNTSAESDYSDEVGNVGIQNDYEWDMPVVSGSYLYVVNCNVSITLRNAPSSTAQEITQIPLYSPVQYIDVEIDGFCKISYNGQTGYALRSYLDVYEPQIYTGIQCAVVNCNESITLRTSSSSSDKEICQIPLGELVDYIDVVDNGFCLVNYNGLIGYVKSDYLAFQ